MKVVISGYYGFDNAGDEAVLTAMLAQLHRLHPGVRPVVLSSRPEKTARRHRVDAIPRLSPGAVARVLRGADLFISGGGTLLQDATGWGSVPYYGGLMLWARRFGVPVFVYAQGIGPLRRPALRRLAGRALAGAAAVTVRDRASAAAAQELGVPAERLAVTADPVFGLAPGPAEIGARFPGPALRACGPGREEAAARWLAALPPGPLIGVSLRPWPGSATGQRPRGGDSIPDGLSLAERVAALLKSRLVGCEARVLPLPLYPSQDGPLLERLVAALGPYAVAWPEEVSPADLSPWDWLELFGRLDLCLTMRLHGLIFAACAGVPFVALGDDPKLAGHVVELGLPQDPFLVPGLDGPEATDRVAAAVAALWHQRAAWGPTVAAGAARLAQRARATARYALAAAKGAAA